MIIIVAILISGDSNQCKLTTCMDTNAYTNTQPSV